MVAPEHRHFAENAAAMLKRGANNNEVMNSFRQLGFSDAQTAELWALAVRLTQQQASAQSEAAPPPRKLTPVERWVVLPLILLFFALFFAALWYMWPS